jgi:hypothetical protein
MVNSCLRVIINQCTDRLRRDPGDGVAREEMKKALSAYDRLPKVRAVAEAGRSEAECSSTIRTGSTRTCGS